VDLSDLPEPPAEMAIENEPTPTDQPSPESDN
jgi:hypothetical protein